MSIERVYPKVKKIIADVLILDEADISLTSRLITDLGAESIDFLDLVFQLEKEFGVKIPRGQLEKNARGALSEDEFEKGGVITEAGMHALKHYLNEVPADYFKPSMKMNEIPTLFTVETFCKLIVKASTEQQLTEAAI